MLAGINTIASFGPMAPRLQLWPHLNATLLQAPGGRFKPDVEMVTSALERLLSNQPSASNQHSKGRGHYNVHTAPQVCKSVVDIYEACGS
jgi:hypothetical protein